MHQEDILPVPANCVGRMIVLETLARLQGSAIPLGKEQRVGLSASPPARTPPHACPVLAERLRPRPGPLRCAPLGPAHRSHPRGQAGLTARFPQCHSSQPTSPPPPSETVMSGWPISSDLHINGPSMFLCFVQTVSRIAVRQTLPVDKNARSLGVWAPSPAKGPATPPVQDERGAAGPVPRPVRQRRLVGRRGGRDCGDGAEL